MLLLKAWLETRWRLALYFGACLLAIAAGHHRSPPISSQSLLIMAGTFLAMLTLAVAGSGVKSQAPVGFPEGLAGSTQFTISLPVTRLRLLTVRAGFGLAETCVATAMVGLLLWQLFPSVRAGTTPADFAKLLLTAAVFLTLPYSAAILMGTFIDEPLSMVYAGWTTALMLWLAHKIAPAVDIVQAWGQASPLHTHAMPWSQLAACVVIASAMFVAAVRIVQAREY